MPKRKSVSWFWFVLGATVWVLTPAMTVRPSSDESVRSELVQLQKQTGLSLVSLLDNKAYVVTFAKRKLSEGEPLSETGTVMSGVFADDGTKIAVDFCRQPGLTPGTTECPGGRIFAILQSDGSVREFGYLANPHYPCWSHDSSKLAFSAQDRRKGRYSPTELQIFDLGTEETQTIGNDSGFVDSQCWSADDKHVVYTASNMGGHGVVSVYDLELKTSRVFSKGSRATWSPDGNWIALMDCPPSGWGCKYYAVRPSGDERKLLFTSESATALWWSPDSRFVAYVNAAGTLERTPPQQLREMVRLRVRRLEDNSTGSFADFFDGDTMDFQWLKNAPTRFLTHHSSTTH
jgi:hypothetical protein